MSDTIQIGNASQVNDDDTERDVNMQRRPATLHKSTDLIERSTEISYLGHLLWLNTHTTMLSALINGAESSDTSDSSDVLADTDVSAFIPAAMERPVAFLCTISWYILVLEKKTKKDTRAQCWAYASNQLGALGANPIAILNIKHRCMALDSSDAVWEVWGSNLCVIPIIWSNNIPYVTTRLVVSVANMNADTTAQQAEWDIHFYVKPMALFE